MNRSENLLHIRCLFLTCAVGLLTATLPAQTVLQNTEELSVIKEIKDENEPPGENETPGEIDKDKTHDLVSRSFKLTKKTNYFIEADFRCAGNAVPTVPGLLLSNFAVHSGIGF
jgi:hypothetical protein